MGEMTPESKPGKTSDTKKAKDYRQGKDDRMESDKKAEADRKAMPPPPRPRAPDSKLVQASTFIQHAGHREAFRKGIMLNVDGWGVHLAKEDDEPIHIHAEFFSTLTGVVEAYCIYRKCTMEVVGMNSAVSLGSH